MTIPYEKINWSSSTTVPSFPSTAYVWYPSSGNMSTATKTNYYGAARCVRSP